MKNLKSYLEELFATPLNTTGMGNVDGSVDIVQPVCIMGKPKKLHKKKKNENNSK